LIAALLNDILPNDPGGSAPTEDQIEALRHQLRELASVAQAEEYQSSPYEGDVHQIGTSEDSSSVPSLSLGEATGSSCYTTDVTDGSSAGFGTPMGFLQTALPHISVQVLRKALVDAERDRIQELDMWELIESIFTAEAVREMEERGLDGLEDEMNALILEDKPWETVGTSQSRSSSLKTSKKVRQKKMTIVDIRQRQHARPTPTRTSTDAPRVESVSDPWVWVSSLSTHIATFLPSQQPEFFKSYFHSPKYSSPYDALRTALASLVKPTSTSASDGEAQQASTTILLLEILLPEYDELDVEERSRLVSDVELCIQATQGQGDNAIELVRILRDLDSDSSGGKLESGIYHFKPRAVEGASPQTIRPQQLPSGPPAAPLPPHMRKSSTVQVNGSRTTSTNNGQWQKVPERRSTAPVIHPLAMHIPAYSKDVNGNKVRSSTGSRSGIVGSRNDMLDEYRRRIQFNTQKRNEMLIEASRMWQRGSAKSRGGEVALYFAEKVWLLLRHLWGI
jgi:hypothetical protein